MGQWTDGGILFRPRKLSLYKAHLSRGERNEEERLL